MRRLKLKHLKAWFCKTKRKPLVLRGARQVGKSTLVRLFAEDEKLDLIEINLEQHRELGQIFATLDLPSIIKSIESVAGKKCHPKSLIFLDEIQATPHAIAALRYFYELRPDLAVISAGSLLEFTLANHSFSMPVGRIEYMFLGPMTFSESLLAWDDFAYREWLEWSPESNFTAVTHQKMLKFLRIYFMTGGMPEAVEVYSEQESLQDVHHVQMQICNTYMDDFSKYANRRDLTEMQFLLKNLPAHIGKKLKYSSILPETKSERVKDLLSLLERARIITMVTRTHGNGIPLGAESDPKFRKVLYLDVGLVSNLLGLTWTALEQSKDNTLINEGPLAEQFIGQHLIEQSELGSELYYWARESSKSNAELDYIVQNGFEIIPLEVKAGVSGTLKSLHQFMYEKKRKHAIRFDLNPCSKQLVDTKLNTSEGVQEVQYELYSYPLYLVEKLPSLYAQF
jgi:uncharacterized protein